MRGVHAERCFSRTASWIAGPCTCGTDDAVETSMPIGQSIMLMFGVSVALWSMIGGVIYWIG